LSGALQSLDKKCAGAPDVVMDSATKYLNGHTDVLAGALVTGRLQPLTFQTRFSTAPLLDGSDQT
jgi:cystathionine beta-lyase/cystathionine gamma-synthase